MSPYQYHRMMSLLAVIFLSLCTAGESMPAPTQSPEQPPLVFPEDSTKYKIISNNSSILRTLTHASSDGNPSLEEVYDMLHSPHFSSNPNIPIALGDKINDDTNNEVSPDLQNELIERIGATVDKDKAKKSDAEGNGGGEAGKWGAVIAALVLAIAAAAYLAMVLWRKSLERKYGSRQVLVNEEDITNNFKHPVVI